MTPFGVLCQMEPQRAQMQILRGLGRSWSETVKGTSPSALVVGVRSCRLKSLILTYALLSVHGVREMAACLGMQQQTL